MTASGTSKLVVTRPKDEPNPEPASVRVSETSSLNGQEATIDHAVLSID